MSDTPSNLYTALLAAQRAMGPVRKDASNPAFRSKYASLQSVFDTIEQPLWDNGLVLVQRFEPDTTGLMLITEIIHAESKERIGSVVPVVGKDPTDPQKMGSAITYYRRYSLLALLGLTPEEDDDGNAAAKPAPSRPQRRTEDDPGPPVKDAPFSAWDRDGGRTPTLRAREEADARVSISLPDPLAPLLDHLADLDSRGEPYAAIKQYATERWGELDAAQRERVKAAMAAIQGRRQAASAAR